MINVQFRVLSSSNVRDGRWRDGLDDDVPWPVRVLAASAYAPCGEWVASGIVKSQLMVLIASPVRVLGPVSAASRSRNAKKRILSDPEDT